MESIYTSSSIVGVPTILLIPSVQKKWGCRNISTHTFHVQVVNGEALTCTEIYQMVSVEIQGFQFKSHLFAVDLQGSDAILRMQWLRSLGHVTHLEGTHHGIYNGWSILFHSQGVSTSTLP
jgi:hypothetical protein